MAYNSNTPNANDRISSTQQPIKNNFVQLETTIQADHVDLNAGADTGKHKHVRMPEQGVKPVVGANEGALYTKVGAVSAETELFFEREDGTEVNTTESDQVATGFTRLPSGMLIQWGQHTTATAATFAIAFPNACLSVTATALQVGLPTIDQLLSTEAPTTTTVEVSNTGPSQAYFYIAIGF